MGKVLNQEGFEEIVLPQDLDLVSAQDELVKGHFDFLTRVTFWSFFKLPLNKLRKRTIS